MGKIRISVKDVIQVMFLAAPVTEEIVSKVSMVTVTVTVVTVTTI